MPSTPKKVALRLTPLGDLKRTGKLLQGPIKKATLQLSSWVEEALPEVLWAILIVDHLPREQALDCFRRVLNKVGEHKDVLASRLLEHSRLVEFDQPTFDLFFAEECALPEVAEALRPLLVLEGLPDRALWKSHLVDAEADGWSKLAGAVANAFDHQSQAATDVRWFKIMTALALGKINLPSTMNERLNEYIDYPNRGDMRSVRPSIRALEMVLRPGAGLKQDRTDWMNALWDECWRRTECIFANPDHNANQTDHQQLLEQVINLHEELILRFIETIETTGIDARHDTCFGLVFFILQLLFFALKSEVGQTVVGRNLLRSAVECYVTLAFLVRHDDPTVWLQFRNYGAGQSKLALLKRINQDEIPSFISTELLEQLANEDMWLEYQDIKLGAWSDKNLRKMAEEAYEKPFYDRYYDASSGYVHGNWSAILHTVFGQCLNPLHRFHRIPLPPRLLLDDAVPDLRKICNLALDKLAHLYPPFKTRLRDHKGKHSFQ